MNKILHSICIGSVALAVAVSGETLRAEPSGAVGKKRGSAKANTAVAASSAKVNAGVRRGAAVRTRNVSGERFRQRNFVKSGANSNAVVNRSKNLRSNRVRAFKDSNVATRTHTVRTHNQAAVKANRNYSVNRTRKTDANHNRHVTVNRARKFERNRTRNVTVNNNWRGSRFAGARYAAFRNYHREFHNRDWWHHHYSRIIFVSGGWWAWNSGYWYPAWGYAPGYAYYPYDGPIYTGSAVLSPNQVVVNVQAQLQRDGYYDGAIDGQLGPMTRQAIADFQADNGLAITSAIDEPTLDSLGVA